MLVRVLCWLAGDGDKNYSREGQAAATIGTAQSGTLTGSHVGLLGSHGWLERLCMTIAFRHPRESGKKVVFASSLRCGIEGR